MRARTSCGRRQIISGKRYKTLPDAFGQGFCIGERRLDFSFAPAGFCSVPTKVKPASEIMRAARRGKQHVRRKHLHCFAYGKKFAEILRKISSDAQNGICAATHFAKLRFCFSPAFFALTPIDSLQGKGHYRECIFVRCGRIGNKARRLPGIYMRQIAFLRASV